MTGESEWVQQISSALQNGDFDTVFEQTPGFLKQCVDPEMKSLLHSCLGSAYQQQHQWKKSIQQYTVALKLDPALYYSRAGRGASLMNIGEYLKALRDVNRVLETHPDYGLAYYVRSGCHLLMANAADESRKAFLFRRAVIDADEATFLDPEDSDYKRLQQLLGTVLNEETTSVPTSKTDRWELAGKIAKVAGQFASGFLK